MADKASYETYVTSGIPVIGSANHDGIAMTKLYLFCTTDALQEPPRASPALRARDAVARGMIFVNVFVSSSQNRNRSERRTARHTGWRQGLFSGRRKKAGRADPPF